MSALFLKTGNFFKEQQWQPRTRAVPNHCKAVTTPDCSSAPRPYLVYRGHVRNWWHGSQ